MTDGKEGRANVYARGLTITQSGVIQRVTCSRMNRLPAPLTGVLSRTCKSVEVFWRIVVPVAVQPTGSARSPVTCTV